MTVEQFCARCDEILVERERTLKEWQVADIHLYKRTVRRTQFVAQLDEYYLTIVGVPCSGKVLKPAQRVGQRMNAKQERLF